jgi:asparagine synthase (glutamine-hydrolysing)
VSRDLPDLRTLCRYGAVLPRDAAALPDLDLAARALAAHGAGAAPAPGEEEARLDALEAALRAAVAGAVEEARARDGAPPAVSLSGGLDSSAVAALASPLGARAATLSTGRAARESAAAARALGIEGALLVEPPPEGPLASPLDEVTAALALPTHSAAPFGFLALWRALAARGIRAVLTGDGADELFAGHAYHGAPHPAWDALGGSPTVDRLFAAWRAVRGLEAEIALDDLLEPGARAALDARHPPWEGSPAARAVAEAARAVRAPAERLRLLDVALRMRAQCVDLQARLARAAGLAYAAPFVERRAAAAALALPLANGEARKRPLRRLLERIAPRASGSAGAPAPWSTLEKEPLHAPTGGRDAAALPAPWREALSEEAARRHGVFRPAAIAALRAEIRAGRAFLPRAAVVAATTHRWLEIPATAPS